jgi:hypothetical protein
MSLLSFEGSLIAKISLHFQNVIVLFQKGEAKYFTLENGQAPNHFVR